MKKFMVLLGMLTIACVIYGIFIHIGGGLMSVFNIFEKPIFSVGGSKADDSAFTEAYKNIEKIEVDMAFGNVTIKEGNSLTVNFEGHKDLQPEIKADGNKLEIKQRKDVKLKTLDFNKYNSELTVTIPSSVKLDEVDAELDMGDCRLKDFSCRKLDADMSMGNLEVKDVKADSIEADNDMGDCHITDSTFDKLTANCDMGNITIKPTEDIDDYGISAQVDMGSIKIDGSDKGRSYSSNGDKTMTLKVSMGDIRVE